MVVMQILLLAIIMEDMCLLVKQGQLFRGKKNFWKVACLKKILRIKKRVVKTILNVYLIINNRLELVEKKNLKNSRKLKVLIYFDYLYNLKFILFLRYNNIILQI